MYSTDQKYHLWKRRNYCFSIVILCFNENVLEKKQRF